MDSQQAGADFSKSFRRVLQEQNKAALDSRAGELLFQM
jgi:hypothetical protein